MTGGGTDVEYVVKFDLESHLCRRSWTVTFRPRAIGTAYCATRRSAIWRAARCIAARSLRRARIIAEKPLPLRKRPDPPLAFPIVAGKVLRSDDAGCTWRAAATIRSLAITASKLRPSSQRRAETGEAAAKALEIAYARHHRPPFVRATP